jgi:hypothetical protein
MKNFCSNEGGKTLLTLEQKKAVFASFNLQEGKLSKNRYNFIFPASKQQGKILARELHESGNGYVLGKYMSQETIDKNGYKVDPRGWVSIKNFSEYDLKVIIQEAIISMS